MSDPTTIIDLKKKIAEKGEGRLIQIGKDEIAKPLSFTISTDNQAAKIAEVAGKSQLEALEAVKDSQERYSKIFEDQLKAAESPEEKADCLEKLESSERECRETVFRMNKDNNNTYIAIAAIGGAVILGGMVIHKNKSDPDNKRNSANKRKATNKPKSK